MIETRDSYKGIVIDGIRYYGKHLVLTAELCNDNLLSIETVTKFITDLVDRIDMIAFGDPVVARFGEGNQVGISAVQLIHTSAIVIHTNDAARDMYLDVFSCKGFDEVMIMDIIKEFFAPEAMTYQTLLRK